MRPGSPKGSAIEVNLAALDHLERIAAALDRGYVLTIDYGYTAEEITARPALSERFADELPQTSSLAKTCLPIRVAATSPPT